MPKRLEVSSIKLSQTGELAVKFTKPMLQLPFIAQNDKVSRRTQQEIDINDAVLVEMIGNDDD